MDVLEPLIIALAFFLVIFCVIAYKSPRWTQSGYVTSPPYSLDDCLDVFFGVIMFVFSFMAYATSHHTKADDDYSCCS